MLARFSSSDSFCIKLLKITKNIDKSLSLSEGSVEVGEGGTPNQKFFFKVENLKLLSGDYEVKVSSKGISNFKNVNKDVEYFIALETA